MPNSKRFKAFARESAQGINDIKGAGEELKAELTSPATDFSRAAVDAIKNTTNAKMAGVDAEKTD